MKPLVTLVSTVRYPETCRTHVQRKSAERARPCRLAYPVCYWTTRTSRPYVFATYDRAMRHVGVRDGIASCVHAWTLSIRLLGRRCVRWTLRCHTRVLSERRHLSRLSFHNYPKHSQLIAPRQLRPASFALTALAPRSPTCHRLPPHLRSGNH